MMICKPLALEVNNVVYEFNGRMGMMFGSSGEQNVVIFDNNF